MGGEGEDYSLGDLITEDVFELTMEINRNEKFKLDVRQSAFLHNCASVQDTRRSCGLHLRSFSILD